MELAKIVATLTRAGWTVESFAALPDVPLNAKMRAYLVYQDRLTFRYHPSKGFIRLMIHAPNDVRCFQIEYGDTLPEVLDALIAIQDELSISTYLTHYLELQNVCPISILMVEQFL